MKKNNIKFTNLNINSQEKAEMFCFILELLSKIYEQEIDKINIEFKNCEISFVNIDLIKTEAGEKLKKIIKNYTDKVNFIK